MNKNNYCVIMAGGIGTRFWPMSKTSHPKQFIDILGTGRTLLQQTYERFLTICPKENIFVVTNEIYKPLTLLQLTDLDESQVISEPSRRNTAPCIAYASYKIAQKNPKANIVVAPSDHIVLKVDVFSDIIKMALEIAADHDWLITLGIKPSRPDTGYGYIQFNEETVLEKYNLLRKVKTFTEKPVLEMAKSFLQSGDFLWNSGIFIWSVSSIMKAFEEHLPEVNDVFKEGLGKYNTAEESSFIKNAYPVCKNISIDYGVMEKANNVHVMISDFGWSDLGTWGSLYETRTKNEAGNTVVGKNVLLYDSTNCIINMPDEKLVVVQGLDDFIIVESENTLLICRKTEEQQIRQFVNDVKIAKGDHFV
jgi:mannose-1-phosphate guanylyltransferase